MGEVFKASKGGVTTKQISSNWIEEKSADQLLYCLLSLESKLSRPESHPSASTILHLTLEHFWRAMGERNAEIGNGRGEEEVCACICNIINVLKNLGTMHKEDDTSGAEKEPMINLLSSFSNLRH